MEMNKTGGRISGKRIRGFKLVLILANDF